MKLVFTLTGHEDWIRTITIEKSSIFPYFLDKLCVNVFVFISDSGSREWFVATCSQDNYIRIWQFLFDENNNQMNVDSNTLKLKRSSFVVETSGELFTLNFFV